MLIIFPAKKHNYDHFFCAKVMSIIQIVYIFLLLLNTFVLKVFFNNINKRYAGFVKGIVVLT